MATIVIALYTTVASQILICKAYYFDFVWLNQYQNLTNFDMLEVTQLFCDNNIQIN